MHIKQVLISGFRSFRSQTEIENFSPKHNVIVGRNGGGKSNFFRAIQFVLVAPEYAILRQEDRQDLLHNGSGTGVMAAYVEIVFDNHDGRLSVDSDEVTIRRTVGHKKDEFFLNRKHVNKSEIVSLLETAGFSKSNPYYIVQQGKVANLCTMNDRARLNLLKEVAGTTVYEERRQESVKIMEKSLTEQSKINEVLDYLNERLSELDAEKSELVEYEKLDRQRRALEFNLYDKEFRDAQAKLEEIEAQREALREQQIALHTQLRDIQDEAAGEEDSLATVKSAHERLRARRDAKNDETTALETKKAELDVQIQDLQEKVNTKSSVLTTTRQQLLELDGVIAQRRRQIEEMSPQIAALIDRRQAEIDELGQIRKRMEIFYAKQGRGQQFSSKAERDRFLQAQIDTLAEQAKKNESIVARKAADFEREGTAIQLERSELAAIESQNAQRTREYDALGKQLREQTLQVNQLIEQRKNNWREIEALRDGIREAEQEAERGKQQLSKTLPRSISDGLKTVEFLVQQRNIRGYFGPLIDNISLKSDAFRAAVEVAAGNNLFNVVVDTDETAAILIKELERAKVGRLTFLPLNRIRTHTFRYPDPTEKEVHPLIQVALEYDPEIEAAVKLIFGAKLIARNIDVASRFAREFNMDAITMEGDVAYSRGNLEGGFHDDRVSRIAAVFKIRQATERLTQLKAQVETLSTQATKVDSQVNELRSSNQKLEVERQQLHNLTEQQTKEQASRAKKLAVAEQALVQGRQEIHNLEKEIDSIREQSETYHREMQTALTQRLTDAERSELRGLEERLRLLQAQHEDTKKEVSILVNDRDQVKIELENGLVKRKEELSLTIKLNSTVEGSEAAAATATGSVDLESALESLQVESAHVAVSLVTSQRALQEMQEAVEVRLRELQHLEGSLEEKKEAEKQLLLQLTALAAEIDRLVNQRSTFMDTMESRQRLIRDLGAIPSKEQAEYQNMKVTQLNRLLKDVQEDLKQFSAVNRKALDQYVSFSEQRETLLQRKSEIDRDAQAITALIDSLDNQKNEAIMRTFTGVSKHFAAVFGELVPGGRGQLIMRTTHDVPDESSAAAASSEAATAEDELEGHVLDNEDNLGATSEGGKLSVAQFKGVEVSVSFTGVGQHYTMQQLSGGQKTLVALAIIFAIQRCDPAPFYLFDEIDSALDANYRMAVARLIHRQATAETSGTQFITTTFRPELVTVADKFFGIKLENKSSNLIPLTKEDAADFVTNLLQDEEAVIKEPSSTSGRGGGVQRGGRRGGTGRDTQSMSQQVSTSLTDAGGGNKRVSLSTPMSALSMSMDVVEEDEDISRRGVARTLDLDEEEEDEEEEEEEDEENLFETAAHPGSRRGSRQRSQSQPPQQQPTPKRLSARGTSAGTSTSAGANRPKKRGRGKLSGGGLERDEDSDDPDDLEVDDADAEALRALGLS